MHSRIFQVSLEPIETFEYIEEADFYDHWFTKSWADYVTDCNREDAIEWLKDVRKDKGFTFGKDGNREYFIIESKEKYFENKFNKFKELLEKLRGCTLKQFAGTEISMDEYALRNAYEDKSGFYVDFVGGGFTSMDDFVRFNPEGRKFYIGGALDYHF